MTMPQSGRGAPTMRGFYKDREVRDHKLSKDSRRRILQFARPYRGKLVVFLVLFRMATGIEAYIFVAIGLALISCEYEDEVEPARLLSRQPAQIGPHKGQIDLGFRIFQ